MMTKTELRILYLMRKDGGVAGAVEASTLTQQMSNKIYPNRISAIDTLQKLGMVTSGSRENEKSSIASKITVYTLTSAGRECIEDHISSGKMKDPDLEKRGRQGGARLRVA